MKEDYEGKGCLVVIIIFLIIFVCIMWYSYEYQYIGSIVIDKIPATGPMEAGGKIIYQVTYKIRKTGEYVTSIHVTSVGCAVYDQYQIGVKYYDSGILN
jgi:hypothetical protein